jgi:hypothetical protein
VSKHKRAFNSKRCCCSYDLRKLKNRKQTFVMSPEHDRAVNITSVPRYDHDDDPSQDASYGGRSGGLTDRLRLIFIKCVYVSARGHFWFGGLSKNCDVYSNTSKK